MSGRPEIRVLWSVTLWGPNAANDPKHTIGGSGATPEEVLRDLKENIELDKDLLHLFDAEARSL